MSIERSLLTDFESVHDALGDLCEGVCTGGSMGLCCRAVDADKLPSPYQRLLAHNGHMTECLRDYHEKPIELSVLNESLSGDLYSRRIVLKLAGSDRVVEFGVVRIDLRYVPDEVRKAILEGGVPLGDILIKHEVLRRVVPRWFLRIQADCPLVSSYWDGLSGAVYGRVGTIYCSDEPAIEVLEVVTGLEETKDDATGGCGSC